MSSQSVGPLDVTRMMNTNEQRIKQLALLLIGRLVISERDGGERASDPAIPHKLAAEMRAACSPNKIQLPRYLMNNISEVSINC